MAIFSALLMANQNKFRNSKKKIDLLLARVISQKVYYIYIYVDWLHIWLKYNFDKQLSTEL